VSVHEPVNCDPDCVGDAKSNTSSSTTSKSRHRIDSQELTVGTGDHFVSMTQLASDEVEQHLRRPGVGPVSPPIPGPSGTRHTLAANPSLRLLVVAGLDTGMRNGELLSLKFGDIDWDRRVVVTERHDHQSLEGLQEAARKLDDGQVVNNQSTTDSNRPGLQSTSSTH
jgi:hypothetical protein